MTADLLPRIGVSLGADPPPALVALCRTLGSHARVVDSGDVGESEPVLHRISDPKQLGRRRCVVWLDHERELAAALRTPAALFLTARDSLVSELRVAGRVARSVPDHDPAPDAAPVAPFVRARLCRAHNLEAEAVLRQGPQRWLWGVSRQPVDPELVDTAMALAGVVVPADRESVIRAMAWGSPIVSTPRAATGLLVDGLTARVVDEAEALDVAGQLREDVRLASRLGWQARLAYEERHSLRCAALETRRALLIETPALPGHLGWVVDDLDSLATRPARRRFEHLVAPLAVPIRSGGTR